MARKNGSKNTSVYVKKKKIMYFVIEDNGRINIRDNKRLFVVMTQAEQQHMRAKYWLKILLLSLRSIRSRFGRFRDDWNLWETVLTLIRMSLIPSSNPIVLNEPAEPADLPVEGRFDPNLRDVGLVEPLGLNPGVAPASAASVRERHPRRKSQFHYFKSTGKKRDRETTGQSFFRITWQMLPFLLLLARQTADQLIN